MSLLQRRSRMVEISKYGSERGPGITPGLLEDKRLPTAGAPQGRRTIVPSNMLSPWGCRAGIL